MGFRRKTERILIHIYPQIRVFIHSFPQLIHNAQDLLSTKKDGFPAWLNANFRENRLFYGYFKTLQRFLKLAPQANF